MNFPSFSVEIKRVQRNRFLRGKNYSIGGSVVNSTKFTKLLEGVHYSLKNFNYLAQKSAKLEAVVAEYLGLLSFPLKRDCKIVLY